MTFKQFYATSQTNLSIIIPSSGKRIYVWNIIIHTETSVSLEFLISNLILSNQDGTRIPNEEVREGAIDESLSLTCGANTTTIILYDEI